MTAVMWWERSFPGTPAQAELARLFVRCLLERSPLCDDGVHVVSELFANAVRHTHSGQPGGLVWVKVCRWFRGARIAVTDQGSEQSPLIRQANPEVQLSESGMGLYTAAALAASLDWHGSPTGRTVVAILGTPLNNHCSLPGHSDSEIAGLAEK